MFVNLAVGDLRLLAASPSIDTGAERGADLEVSQDSLVLTEGAPSVSFNVLNLGQVPLNWTPVSNDSRVAVSLSSGVNDTMVAVSASEFSQDLDVLVTVINEDEVTDFAMVMVEVTVASQNPNGDPVGCAAAISGERGSSHSDMGIGLVACVVLLLSRRRSREID